MATFRARFYFTCVIFFCALFATRSALAWQVDSEPRPASEHPDYALLNQPGPLWLPGADLSHQNLYGVNLANANLREANFDAAILAKADLSDALLVLATLRYADLSRTDLSNATLSLADLRNARLLGADLSGANMLGTMLTSANLDSSELSGVDLRESDLKRASLRSANLGHAQLSGANLQGADLTNADLSHADLSSVNLAEANLDRAKMENVTYDSVTVWPANFNLDTMAINGPMPGQKPSSERGGDNLSIIMTLTPQLLPWYSQVVRPQDGSLVENAQQTALLDAMAIGDRMVIFKSAGLAEELVPLIADKMDTIGYNLEHGPLTPLHEQNDPVDSVKRMRALADAYGLRLAFGPDHRFALSHGVLMAPYIDSYAMQVQRVQSDPQTVREFVVPMAEAVRAANSDIETTLQVRTEGEAATIASLVDSVRESIDGVVILSSRETAETAVELVELLQSDGGPAPAKPVNASASETEASTAESPLEEPQSKRPSIAMIALQLLALALAVAFAFALWHDMTSRRRSR